MVRYNYGRGCDELNKQQMRKDMLERIQELTPNEKQKIESAIHKHFLNSSLFKSSKVIGITHAQLTEWSTISIIEHAWKQCKTVALPKSVSKNHRLDFYVVDNLQQLIPGYAGIMEPDPNCCIPIRTEEIDLLVVPGVVFDKQGYRIGYGGGFYDRLLANYKGKTVSLVGELQIVENIPKEHFDLPVQYMISERYCYELEQS